METLMTRSVPDGAAMLENELNPEMKKPEGFIVGGSVKSFVPPRSLAPVSLMERSLPSDYGSCSLPYSANGGSPPAEGARSPLRFIDDKPSLPRSLTMNKPQVPEKKPALLKAVASSGLRRSESMKETGSQPVTSAAVSSSTATPVSGTSKTVSRRAPKAKYSLPGGDDETKYYSLPRRGKSGGSLIKRSNSNCSLKSVDGAGSKQTTPPSMTRSCIDEDKQHQVPKLGRQLPQPPVATATLDPKKLRPPRTSPENSSLSRSPKRSPPMTNGGLRHFERTSNGMNGSTASLSGSTSIYATLPRNKAKKAPVRPLSPDRSESGRESAASNSSSAPPPKPPPKPVHLTPVATKKEVCLTKSGTLPRNMGRMKKAESEGRPSSGASSASSAATVASSTKTRSASTPRTATNRVQSPSLRNRKDPPSTTASAAPKPPAAKPPRPVIYLENSTQTLLTLEDIQTAMARAATPSSCAICDANRASAEDPAKVLPLAEAQGTPVPTENGEKEVDVWNKTCEVGIQVEINFYDPNKAYTVADTQNLLRQLRKLTEEHSKLESNYARLRSAVSEVDRLKSELKKLHTTLEEEVAIKNEVQQELDQTSSRVQSMLSSLEGVEKEFTSRGNSLADLETQLDLAQRTILNQQVEIETNHNIIVALQQDLEKSVAAQKTLFQQLQETEAESRELQDFLQSEKNTLSDALREAEKTMNQLRCEAEDKEKLLHEQTLRCSRLMQLSSVEERRLCSSPFEERGVGDGTDGDQDSVSVTSSAKEMLLHQGAQLSSSAVALENLYLKISALHKVVAEKKAAGSNSKDQESNLMCDLLRRLVGQEDCTALLEASSEVPNAGSKRRQKTLLFDDVDDPLEDGLNASQTSTLNSSSSNMLESVIEEDEDEETNGEEATGGASGRDAGDVKLAQKASHSDDGAGRSLSEQVTDIDDMLSEFLKCVLSAGAMAQRSALQLRQEREELVNLSEAKDRELATLRCAVHAATSPKVSPVPNGTSSPNAIEKKALDTGCVDKPDPYVLSMKSEMSRIKLKLLEKDAEMREKEERHARHAQILLENWRRAEAELSRLDDAMDRVVLTLQGVPEVVTTCPALKKLLIELGSLNCGIPFKSPAINGAGPSSLTSSSANGQKHRQTSNGTLLEADELETVID